MASDTERGAMRRAIAASAEVLGTTNPNPAVGAVILDPGGAVLATGVTQAAGGRHAEIVALEAAGAGARGGTLVVTLEPCRHIGRTGPCTEAILGAGIARVVYAVADPHAEAAGGGSALQDAGVVVEAGVLRDEASVDLSPWLHAITRRRPHVTWKYAATLDGRTAAADGTSRWITGPQARVDVHRERALADAVVVGIGTVLADDTRLTVRDWPSSRQPLRVVADAKARTPLSANILDSTAATLVAVTTDAPAERIGALRATGVDVCQLPASPAGVDLPLLLATLFERECLRILVEGGARLAGSFIREGLVDRVIGYHAPALLGSGPPVLGDTGVTTIADARRLRLVDVSPLGDDVRIVADVDRSGS